MLKRIFLLLLFLTNTCFANYAHAISENTNKYDELLREFEEVVEKINPELVQKIKDKNNFQKYRILKSYTLKATAELYLDFFINKMYQLSNETGRKIKKYDENHNRIVVDTIKKDNDKGMVLYWLDRGKLDEKECLHYGDWNKCPYPEDYKEVMLQIDTYGNEIIVDFEEDIVVNNEKKHVAYKLSFHGTAYDSMIDFVKFSWDYLDYYREQTEIANFYINLEDTKKQLSKRQFKKYQEKCTASEIDCPKFENIKPAVVEISSADITYYETNY